MTITKKIKVYDYQIASEDKISESLSDSNFLVSSDWVSFNLKDDSILTVEFIVEIHGHLVEEKGDYFTPPTSDLIIHSIDIYFKKIFIDDIEIELKDFNDESLDNLKHLIINLYN